MKRFTVRLKHDKGIFRLIVSAQNEEVARLITTRAEKCPDNAILSIKENKS